MIIHTITWHVYRIPLRKRFVTAHGTLTARLGAIVEIGTSHAIQGFGEVAPLPGFSSDTLAEALAALATLAPSLRGQQLSCALKLLYTRAEQLPASLVYGLETALLDALGKHEDCSISTLLAASATVLIRARSSETASVLPQRVHAEAASLRKAPRPSAASFVLSDSRRCQQGSVRYHVPINAVIGGETLEATVWSARKAVAAGVQCVKLKMGTGGPDDIERVAAVREAIGRSVHLRLDANAAWTFEQAVSVLSRCALFDIQYVEQPLTASDLAGLRRLREMVSIPIAVDESLYSRESARRLLAAEAADIFMIKPQMVGGLRAGQIIIREAAEHSIQCVVTSTLEAGIGVVAALHLAASSPAITLECGLATLDLLVDDFLAEGVALQNGFLAVPTAAGLGVLLDRAALNIYRWNEMA